MTEGEKITLPAGQSSAWYEFSGPSAAELEEQLRDFYSRVDHASLEVGSPTVSMDFRAIRSMHAAAPARMSLGPWQASVHVERHRGWRR